MRYEQKFVFDNNQYQTIVNKIMQSTAIFTEIYRVRKINNIYLDTVDYDNFYANIDGATNRTKHRIRWYGNTVSPQKAVLEYKIKNGMLGTKKHFKMPGFSLDEKFRYSEYLKRVNQLVAEKDKEKYYQMYSDISALMPSLYNTYKRIYFMSCDKRYRITIDTDMTFSKIGEVLYGMQEYKIDDIVVELKYDNKDAAGAEKIVQDLGFRLYKNSKYVNGISNV